MIPREALIRKVVSQTERLAPLWKKFCETATQDEIDEALVRLEQDKELYREESRLATSSRNPVPSLCCYCGAMIYWPEEWQKTDREAFVEILGQTELASVFVRECYCPSCGGRHVVEARGNPRKWKGLWESEVVVISTPRGGIRCATG